ncbi:HAD family hydrolase [Danxiaibacter flavus]|uniref:HAD family hydrolase n=1 Tax=Danxiaibacter flavus TaxID=3049108 RepID=A0ABV3ZDB4_9BACT|nr:HAD family hydrolase [Chitinophagaceae bacterium DXS]
MDKKTLVLFDFDGTITEKDTLLEIIKYQQGSSRYYRGMLKMMPKLLMFKAGLVANQDMKEAVMTYFWKGLDEKQFEEACKKFASTMLPRMLRDKAIEQLKKHVENGDEVTVVSASAEDWVLPFCQAQGIKCIASKMQKVNNRLTGKLNGLNCNGEEKVNRIKKVYNLEEYDTIIAYGDSSGDRQMLGIATNANYKPFRN